MNPSAPRFALVVLVAAAMLAGCGQESPESLLTSAKGYLAKKDSKAAVIQLKSALQKQPDLREARFLLGRTLLEAGDAVSAEVELRKALELKHPAALVLPPLTRALVHQGKAQRALQDYASTEFAEPAATAEMQTELATAYAQQGDVAKTLAALDKALLAVPGFTPAQLMQARLKASSREFDAAFALLDQIIAKDPRNHEALQLKGDLLFFVKADAAGAIEAQRQALSIRKDWLPAHTSILEILLSRADTLAAAKTQFDELKKVLPNHPQTRFFEARFAFLNKDFKTARELAQQLVKLMPDNVNVLLLAGRVEFQMNSLGQAETLVSKAVQLAPNLPTTRRLLAQIYLRSGQAPKAQETLAPLLDRPDVDSDTLVAAAQAALQTDDPKKAEAYFSRAAKLNPNDKRARIALALAQFTKGQSDIGFAQLEEVASSDAGTVADMAIISARLRQRDYPAALKAIDALERKQPDKPFAQQLRGQVQVLRKDVAGARQSFAKAAAIDPMFFPAAASLAALDLRDKKPDEARKHFDKMLAVDPKNVQALLAIAELRAQAGASKEEIAGLLANASKFDTNAPLPRLLLVELHLRTKDNKAALAAAQDAAAALPENPELLDALGRAQMASGDANQAIASFNKLVGLQRRSPQPHLRLAEAYLALKRPADARESLNRALEVSPKFLPAQRALVMVELSAGRPEQALAMARTVQSERPEQNLGYLLAGDIEAFRKSWAAAAAAYRAGLKRDPSTELASKLHAVLQAGQKPTEAETFAAGWIKEHPQDMAFRTYLGDLALSKLDFGGAEPHYLAVVKLQPESAIALNNLAWITNKLKKPGAAAYAERANALRPDQPAFMDTLATILDDAGQTSKALELEKKASALAPNHAQIRLSLAKLYLKAGDKTQAKIELDKLAGLGDKFAGQAEVGQLLKSM